MRQCADTVVHVVTDAVGIGVRNTVTATGVEGVELVAITVAIANRDVKHPHS